jgi:hypothetical protein
MIVTVVPVATQLQIKREIRVAFLFWLSVATELHLCLLVATELQLDDYSAFPAGAGFAP